MFLFTEASRTCFATALSLLAFRRLASSPWPRLPWPGGVCFEIYVKDRDSRAESVRSAPSRDVHRSMLTDIRGCSFSAEGEPLLIQPG